MGVATDTDIICISMFIPWESKDQTMNGQWSVFRNDSWLQDSGFHPTKLGKVWSTWTDLMGKHLFHLRAVRGAKLQPTLRDGVFRHPKHHPFSAPWKIQVYIVCSALNHTIFPEPAEPAEPASSSSRFVGPKVHQTPFDLLEGLLPSREFSILLDENAWRFRVECKVKGQVFEPPYQNKTFSRAFNETTVTWQEALQEIHKYMWKKWDLIKKKAPMLSTEMQEPGHVNQEAFSMA